MMYSKTRPLALLCTFALMLGILCQGFAAVAVAEAAKEAPVTIKWLAYQTLAQPDPDAPVVRQLEELFNCKFEFMFVDNNNWDETLNVKLAAGEIPDVLRVNDRSMLSKYIEQGIAVELPFEVLEEKAPNYMEVVRRYDEDGNILRAMMYDGKNYGFSNINLDRVYGLPIMWNKDWLDAVGIETVPATITEYEKAMDLFRNGDPDGNGAKDTYGMSNSMFKNIYAAYGLTSVPGDHTNMTALKRQEDGSMVFSCATDRAKEVLALLADWYSKGYIDPEYITGENRGGYTHLSLAYTTGTIGVSGLGYFYHWYPEASYSVADELTANGLAINYVPGVPIVGPYGDSGATQRSLEANSVIITSVGAEKPRVLDTALAILNKMYSDDEDYYVLNTYGIEGVHWAFDDKGERVSLLGDVNPRRVGIEVLTFASQNPDMSRRFAGALYSEWGDKYFAYPGLITPSVVPAKDYADANARYLQDLTKLTTETFTAIITGAQSVDTFDAYRDTFLKNGGQAIQDAATKANAGQ